MKNIMVALDLSDSTGLLIDHARKLCAAEPSKLWMVHVVPPNPDFIGLEIGPSYIRDNIAEDLREQHRSLQDLASKLNEEGLECSGLMVQGVEADAILEEVERLNVDTLVVGTNAHGTVYDLLIGSVCSTLIKKCPVPMMVIPTRKSS